MIRHILKHALIVFLTLVILFCIFEIYYSGQEKKANPFSVEGLYKIDPYTSYSLKPNLHAKEFKVCGEKKFYVSTTPDGLRGTFYPIERRPNTVRIAILGSSFTFGYGVNDGDTFCEVLKRRCEEDPLFDRAVEVINGGLPNTHGAVFVAQYLSKIQKYKPDVVIIVTQPGDPFYGDISTKLPPLDPDFEKKSCYYLDKRGVLKTRISMSPFWKYLSERSAFIRAMLVRKNISQDNEALRAYWESVEHQKDECLKPIIIFTDLLLKRRIYPIVLVRHWFGQFTDKPTPQQIMVEKLKERGITAFDLRPLFEPYENERRYLLDDGHWNEAGHQLVAGVIYDLLKENKSNIEEMTDEKAKGGFGL